MDTLIRSDEVFVQRDFGGAEPDICKDHLKSLANKGFNDCFFLRFLFNGHYRRILIVLWN